MSSFHHGIHGNNALRHHHNNITNGSNGNVNTNLLCDDKLRNDDLSIGTNNDEQHGHGTLNGNGNDASSLHAIASTASPSSSLHMHMNMHGMINGNGNQSHTPSHLVTVSPLSSPSLTAHQYHSPANSSSASSALPSPLLTHATPPSSSSSSSSSTASRGWPMVDAAAASVTAMPPRHGHIAHINSNHSYMLQVRDTNESPVSALTSRVARVSMQSPLPTSPTSSSPSPSLSSSSEPLESPPHMHMHGSLSSPSPSPPSPYSRATSGGRQSGIHRPENKSRSQSLDAAPLSSSSSSNVSSRGHGGVARPAPRRPTSGGSSRSSNISTPSEVRMKSLGGSAPPSGRSSVALPSGMLPSHNTSMVTRSYSNEARSSSSSLSSLTSSSSSHHRSGSGDSQEGNASTMSIQPEFACFASRSAPSSNLSSPTGVPAGTGSMMFRSISHIHRHNGVMSPVEHSRSPSPHSGMSSPIMRVDSPFAGGSPNRSPSPVAAIFGASSRSNSSNDLRGFAAANAAAANGAGISMMNDGMVDSGRRPGNNYRSMPPPPLITNALHMTNSSSSAAMGSITSPSPLSATNVSSSSSMANSLNLTNSARNSPMQMLRRYGPLGSPQSAHDDEEELEMIHNQHQRHHAHGGYGSQFWGTNSSHVTLVVANQGISLPSSQQVSSQSSPRPLRYALVGRAEPGTPLNWNSNCDTADGISSSSAGSTPSTSGSNHSNGGSGAPLSAFPVTPSIQQQPMVAPFSASSSSSAMDTTSEREDDGSVLSMVPDPSGFSGSPGRPIAGSFESQYNGALPLGQISPSPSPPRLVPQSGIPLASTPRAAPVASLFSAFAAEHVTTPPAVMNGNNDDSSGLRRPLSVSIEDSASPPSGSPASAVGMVGMNGMNVNAPPLTDTHAVLMRRTRSDISNRFSRNLFGVTAEESATAVPLMARRTPTPSPHHGGGAGTAPTSSSSSLASSASSSPQRAFPHFNGSMAPPSAASSSSSLPGMTTMSRSQSVGGLLSSYEHAMMSMHHGHGSVPSGRIEPAPMNMQSAKSPSHRQQTKEKRRHQAHPAYAAPTAAQVQMQQRSQTPTAAAGRRMAGYVNPAGAWDYVPKLPSEAGGRLISHATLASLLHGERKADFDRVMIIDCRFPYEYDGGHIRGAINLTNETQARNLLFNPPVPSERVAIIFHCEFSQQRGPRGWQWVRETDRTSKGLEAFGELFYPELYILREGYREFHRSYPSLCERTAGSTPWIAPAADVPLSLPPGSNMADESIPTVESYGNPLYTPMLHPAYAEQNRYYQRTMTTDWPKQTGSVRNARR